MHRGCIYIHLYPLEATPGDALSRLALISQELSYSIGSWASAKPLGTNDGFEVYEREVISAMYLRTSQ